MQSSMNQFILRSKPDPQVMESEGRDAESQKATSMNEDTMLNDNMLSMDLDPSNVSQDNQGVSMDVSMDETHNSYATRASTKRRQPESPSLSPIVRSEDTSSNMNISYADEVLSNAGSHPLALDTNKTTSNRQNES